MYKILFPISDFLYLLQLEEYETKRYFSLLNRFFWRRNLQKRGKLVWTKRIKITFAVSILPSIILFLLTPVWVGLANAFLGIFSELAKNSIYIKASSKFKKSNTKVIMIAGSFGKTTTKNYINELIKYNYKTQMIPGNINTLTGIANWLNNNFDKTAEVLVAEVDPYYVGEIREACKIIPPDIAILTYVGDQHLERLGSKKNLKIALEEVFKYSKPNAIKIKNKKSNLDYALEVAKILKIPKDIIIDTVKKLSRPDRRGDIKMVNSFELIDHSYNISESTAINAIGEAVKIAKHKSKSLIAITAGIPELGEENKDANINLGKVLSKKADKIILLKSVFYTEVLEGLDSRLRGNDVAFADDLTEAWKILEDYDPKKNIILMFPELNDLYY